MERVKRWKEKILRGFRYHNSSGYSRLGYWLVVIAGSASLVGCTTLKKMSIVSLSAGGGALVGGLASTGILAPVAGAVVTSAVADVVTEVAIGKGGKGAMSNCAPDNFWSLLGSLIEMGGWALILIVVVPMIFSWLMPGPIKFKGRNKNNQN
jgi:FtsH-binding integral membrane protein